MNLTIKPNSNNPIEMINRTGNEFNKTHTNNSTKEIPKNATNDMTDKVEKEPIQYNISLSRYVELKSHFDVIRKLGYLPNINSLVSISEVSYICLTLGLLN